MVLIKIEWMYIIVGVFRVVLILIDEVHHFIIGALALANAGFLTPFFDGITDGVIHVFANILEFVSTFQKDKGRYTLSKCAISKNIGAISFGS